MAASYPITWASSPFLYCPGSLWLGPFLMSRGHWSRLPYLTGRRMAPPRGVPGMQGPLGIHDLEPGRIIVQLTQHRRNLDCLRYSQIHLWAHTYLEEDAPLPVGRHGYLIRCAGAQRCRLSPGPQFSWALVPCLWVRRKTSWDLSSSLAVTKL